MPEPNKLLRAARERRESPSAPGRPLSRQDLADLLNQQTYSMSGTITSIDANHIGKWERGIIRWPAVHYRAALRVIFDVATDAELGFAPPGASGNPLDVDRKTFLKSTLGAGAWAMVGSRATVGSDELSTALAGPTEHYRSMESRVSSLRLGPAVEAHLRFATDLVQETTRTTCGFSVLSETAGLAAWLAADRGEASKARRHYVESMRYAESAGHPLLVAYMTASFGHYAVESGDTAQGLRLLQRATAVIDDSAPAAARAWLASLRAVGHAAQGDTVGTMETLRHAEKLAEHPGTPQWPWMFAFTPAKVARYQCGALGRLGDLRSARVAYAAAGAALTSPKPRALAQVEHAETLAGAGLLDEASHLAVQAATVAQRYGSERITERVRRLRARLRTNEAHELDKALAPLYGEDR